MCNKSSTCFCLQTDVQHESCVVILEGFLPKCKNYKFRHVSLSETAVNGKYSKAKTSAFSRIFKVSQMNNCVICISLPSVAIIVITIAANSMTIIMIVVKKMFNEG